MDHTDPLDQAGAIATAIEQLADQLRPEVIRAARKDESGKYDKFFSRNPGQGN